MKTFIKTLLIIVCLTPAAFLFHFYEYNQHINGEEAPFLLLGILLFIVVTGVLSIKRKVRYMLLINIGSVGLSLILANLFIPNDTSWFKPFERDIVILLTGLFIFICQLVIHLILLGTKKLTKPL
ncbi:hypothetical protein AJ85_07085 [Alkalihalobacillus alcalophilus ATCC 27647 = CGMCC 1.3604]|uniref:Uncharacterized protein n=1 Tax=Alkalihalobacillus alcalophilus ATCC 27647 = CGMCC 1.3604 TaxID=1218173 RepID=A0A4S4K0G7_ALKAL|nr:hypothetical protein [Alkalihalobacillus alcalophilus]MED1564049.1 hypothetical protein [Alkalihalobacillus alcalophilus]THG91085.1 hypothetical protein AJ85_07085 [Alkalihalobacillus alcalophilus ATCC 27647 = CGMCC 1.3604]